MVQAEAAHHHLEPASTGLPQERIAQASGEQGLHIHRPYACEKTFLGSGPCGTDTVRAAACHCLSRQGCNANVIQEHQVLIEV